MKIIRYFVLLICFIVLGCVGVYEMPVDFQHEIIKTKHFQIATWQRISDSNADVHIYIEGDGNSFDAYGRPTSNPTPKNTMFRELVARDKSSNVVYIARPCQFVSDDVCNIHDWTDARFSANVIDSISYAIKKIAKNRPVVLIGYSGGALVSGLVISRNSDIKIRRWITIAGVLNHADWTRYFGDEPLYNSLNMNKLPRVSQNHYIMQDDAVVPNELSRNWLGDNYVVVPNATHSDFKELTIF